MAVSANHYHYRDLLFDLCQVGRQDLVDQLEALTSQISQLKNEREKLARQFFNENQAALKPQLRPCHQRRLAAEGHLDIKMPDFS